MGVVPAGGRGTEEVALAVVELPAAGAGVLPGSEAGAVVALAKSELLLTSSPRESVSGSSDPYALRRAGNGLL